MTDNATLLQQLQSCAWAANVGQPEETAKTYGTLADIAAFIESDPEAFFETPYEIQYESLCVTDHNLANSLKTKAVVNDMHAWISDNEVDEISKSAYLSTWKMISVAEVCALTSDDADTLATLLRADVKLSAFTSERLSWYLSGRIPFGYIGTYPNGRWLIL